MNNVFWPTPQKCSHGLICGQHLTLTIQQEQSIVQSIKQRAEHIATTAQLFSKPLQTDIGVVEGSLCLFPLGNVAHDREYLLFSTDDHAGLVLMKAVADGKLILKDLHVPALEDFLHAGFNLGCQGREYVVNIPTDQYIR